MRSSCDFFRWDIWIAKVKYEDSEEVKVRPVLIVNGMERCVLSLKITSHTPRESFDGEYQVVEWEKAGLIKPSTIRIGKRIILPEEAFIKKIGRLTDIDRTNVEKEYMKMYDDLHRHK